MDFLQHFCGLKLYSVVENYATLSTDICDFCNTNSDGFLPAVNHTAIFSVHHVQSVLNFLLIS